jgi:NADH-quinone oxidoreductase subunit L
MYRSYYMTFTGEYRGGEGHHDEHNEDPHSAVAAPVLASSHAVHASDGAVHAHGHADHAHGHDTHGHVAAPAHGAHGHGHDAGHAAHDAHAADDAHAHGGHHGGTPHESPWTITLVLSLLAIGSGLTLFLGIPVAWTGVAPVLEHWLEPALPAMASVPFAQIGDAHHHHQMELLFQGIGVAVAFVGWLAARALYKDAKSDVPARLKARFERIWTVVYNKYYVDELYAATVIRGSTGIARAFSRFDGGIIDGLVNFVGAIGRFLGRIDAAIDRYLVDGAVNAVANATLGLGRSFRTLQTGRIQTYLYGALGGALVVVLLNFLIQ